MTPGAIDAHQHFWAYDPARLPWVAEGSVLAADRLPEHLLPLLNDGGVAQTILVQVEQREAETRWMLDLADRHSWIAGVVGWCDLQAEDVGERLERLRHPRLVGLRHMVQDETDPHFLRRPGFIAGVREAARRGLTYDLLIVADQAPCAPRFIDTVGDGRFVLDHGAKPKIRERGWRPWADAIAEIGRLPNVWCKVSGLVTEADHAAWTAEDIAPYLDHLLECFGPERLIFGSDWPVCTLAAAYDQVQGLIEDFVTRRCPEHAASVFGGAARRAYALDGRE